VTEPIFHMIGGAPDPVAPFSHAVETDGWVFVTGQMPFSGTSNTLPYPEGIEAQTRQVMENLQRVLAGCGLGLEHVLSARVFLTRFEEDYERMNAVYSSYFPAQRRPARTCVGVTALARGALVEIDFVARRPSGRSGVFDSFLDELEARTAIEDCLKRFARAVDRQDWKAARTCYHDDAFDDHGFFKGPPDAFLAHVATLHEHQDHSMHFNTNVLIEFSSKERAFVETYVLVLQRYRAGAPNVPAGSQGLRNLASARYLDRFEKKNGEWRVAHRTLVFGDIVAEEMKAPHRFPPEFTEQKHGLDDPLYRLRSK
jgi:2-iminobutanoate/2-iminopropanoate deaminase